MIILCEPQCFGLEHAAFNAALLATVGAAYPGDEVLFFGEPSHLREVESILTRTPAPAMRVIWQPIEIPPPVPGGLRRLPAERQLVQAVLEHARSTQARHVLFCSATEITVLTLKQILSNTPPAHGVQIVLHGVLRSLIEPRWRKPWRWGFSLRQALRLPHPASLKYIALSESIRENAVRVEPNLSASMRAMDMPRLWNSVSVVTHRDAFRVRFGFFGSTAKGFQIFYEMARAIKSQNITADFSLIGFLNGRDLQRDYHEDIVDGLSREPLAQKEYSRRAAAIDYAVWPANPAHYSLTASASFLDALDYLKPIIYLANPYIDSYFEKLGDIGYRCETPAQMQATMEEVGRAFPAERYEKQREAMRRGRELFAPAIVAPTLKRILEEGSANSCAY